MMSSKVIISFLISPPPQNWAQPRQIAQWDCSHYTNIHVCQLCGGLNTDLGEKNAVFTKVINIVNLSTVESIIVLRWPVKAWGTIHISSLYRGQTQSLCTTYLLLTSLLMTVCIAINLILDLFVQASATSSAHKLAKIEK